MLHAVCLVPVATLCVMLSLMLCCPARALGYIMSVAHTVIPSPKSTAATRELKHKGDINYKTIAAREREILDFNITLLTGAITRCRHLAVDTHRTYVGRTRQYCQNIPGHQMIVTANRTCVLLATEGMITQRIKTHLAGTLRATLGVGKHLGDRGPKTPAEKSLPNVWRGASQ